MRITDFMPTRPFRKAFMLVGLFVSSTLCAATFTVTTTADSGAGSLRDAIGQVNAGTGNDTIAFIIPGVVVHRIQPLSDLPAITQPNTTIDGYTQPGTLVNTDTLATNAILLIEINGSNYTVGDGLTTGIGLTLGTGSAGSTIRGLVINEWLLQGILVTDSPNSKIYGNFIGTSADGYQQSANRCGLSTTDSTGVLVGSALPADRNLIAGSFEFVEDGYSLSIDGSGSLVKGNLIGINRTGTAALGNSVVGMRIRSGVTVGGPTAAERNVISGSLGAGVFLQGASNTVIEGNYIGTDITGTLPIGNQNSGILIVPSTGVASANNLIQGNLISANGVGIKLGGTARLSSFRVNNNHIEGNLIGTDASGLNALGNTDAGIWLIDGNNFVGGALSSKRNIISGNGGNGIIISDFAANSIVQGNHIGVDITGSRALGNGDNGVLIGLNSAQQLANNNLIGGLNPGEGNLISGNRNNGVLVKAYVTGNQIFGNLIGTDFTGMNPIPNGSAGIRFLCAPQNIQGENTIRFNKCRVVICNTAKSLKLRTK